jgi:hypothetical protein
MRHLQLLDLPSCLRAADLEAPCLERLELQHLGQPELRAVDEADEVGLGAGFDQALRFVRSDRFDLLHLQHEFCSDCVRHVFRDDAFLLRLGFQEYVADQTVVHRPVVHRPVAARGLEPLRSFHSLCLLVSCIGYRTNAASLPTLCNIVAVQRFNLPQRGVACQVRIAIA